MSPAWAVDTGRSKPASGSGSRWHPVGVVSRQSTSSPSDERAAGAGRGRKVRPSTRGRYDIAWWAPGRRSPQRRRREGDSMVDDDPVLLEVKGGVAVISLNRPDQHNMVGDAADALFFRYLDLLRNDRDVRVVVWRGNGPSFSSGRDLGELQRPPRCHRPRVHRAQPVADPAAVRLPGADHLRAQGLGRSASSWNGRCCATCGWPARARRWPCRRSTMA